MRLILLMIIVLIHLAGPVGRLSVLIGAESVKHDNSKAKKDVRRIADAICGPKCVQYVLDYYGQTVDMCELVRQIQWPDIEQGAKMRSLADALENRGIHTYLMRISSLARIVWPYPVIVHLEKQDGRPMGHFVVWQPKSSGPKIIVWSADGEGEKAMSESDWLQLRSGAVLLTSPQAIDNPMDAVQYAGIASDGKYPTVIRTILVAVGVLSCFVAFFRYIPRFSRKVIES